jgi:signal transduction histidine kinase/phage shock protein PspC (stress-responsive transcriptional regulator)
MVAGVACGVAAKIGLDVTVVRIGVVLASVFSGVGVAAYVVAWLVLPAPGGGEAVGRRALRDGRGLALVGALLPGLAVVLALASALGIGWVGAAAWPALIAAGGLILLWRNGSAADRRSLQKLGRPLAAAASASGGSRQRLAWRAAGGVVVAAVGVVLLATGRRAMVLPLLGVMLVLGGVVVMFGPWWLRLGRDLMVERQARVRAEERADMAARVHDSVLQTLALIQRSAGDPQRVAQLARAQERELRAWLFEGRTPGDIGGEAATLAGAVAAIQSEVEAAHGVVVDAVVVGDLAVTPAVGALLGAAREATANAARWSGADVVSLYAEVERDRVSVFVRDRGRGFDRAAVAADRRGVRDSIEGRMSRCGGCAAIRTAPGKGTEVELSIPLGERPVVAR